jgi:hypothetical protein
MNPPQIPCNEGEALFIQKVKTFFMLNRKENNPDLSGAVNARIGFSFDLSKCKAERTNHDFLLELTIFVSPTLHIKP